MPLKISFSALALLALAGTWTFNIRHMLSGRPGLAFLTDNAATAANLSVSVDILLACILLFPWMVREARAKRIRGIAAYLIGSATIAVSVMFPVFLTARMRKPAPGRIARPPRVIARSVFAAGLVATTMLRTMHLVSNEGPYFDLLFATPAAASIAVDLAALWLAGVLLAIQLRGSDLRVISGTILLSLFSVSAGFAYILTVASTGQADGESAHPA